MTPSPNGRDDIDGGDEPGRGDIDGGDEPGRGDHHERATAGGRTVTTRRAFLQAAGAGAAATALAGCNGSQSERSDAAPAILAQPGASGYALATSRTLTTTVERASDGSTGEVTVGNVLRTYEGGGTPTEWVATLTSPTVEVAGESVALLADDPIPETLRTDGEAVLAETVLAEGAAVSWRSGPATVARFEGRLLGSRVKGETVVGATGSGEVVVAHAARTHNEGDVVLVASVRSYPAPEPLPDVPPADLLGAGGVPDATAIGDQQGSFADVLATVTHPATGTAAPPAVVGDDVNPRAVVSDVSREPMGGGRDRITATYTRFDSEEGLVSERVRFDDLGFRQTLIDRAPDLSADVTSDVPLPPRPTDSPGGDSLLGRVRRTLDAATAAIGGDGWTAVGETGVSAGHRTTGLPDQVSLKSDQTPLKHQGGRGTCVSFCACSAMEAAYNRAGYGELDLSEQYLNHLQKTAFLHTAGQRGADGTLSNDGFENFLATGGGSALGYMLPLLTEYGVPREQDAQYQPASADDPYYIYDGDYENTGQSGDSLQAYTWNDPSSMSQAVVDGFNLQDEETSYQIAPNRTDFRITPFPGSALRAAHYGIDDYVYVGSGDDNAWLLETPLWYEYVLDAGFEVMIGFATGETKLAEPRPDRSDYDSDSAFQQAVQQWKDDDGDVQVYDSSGSGGGHCICLVGYDTTGNRNHFVAKDNYNNYTKMGYDLFTNGVIGEAGYIRQIRDPSPDEFHRQDFLGRYDVTYDGGSGTLDVHRLPHFFDPDRLPGGSDQPTADRRIGSFVAEDGTLYRVNGQIVRRGPSPIRNYTSFAELHWTVDFSDPNQPYDSTSGTTFVGFVNVEDTSFIAGWRADSDGIPLSGFHGAREPFDEGTAGVASNSPDALLGEWDVHSPFHTDGATLVVDEVDSFQDTFTARLRNPSSPPQRSDYSDPVTGTLDYSEWTVSLSLDAAHLGSGGTPGTFDGYLHRDTLARVSGTYTYEPEGAQAPMVLVRQDVEPFVEIVSPADGATVTGGTRSKKTTTLEAFLVGPPGATVRWRATDQDTDHTTIVGEGEQIGAALAPGTYTIEARYAGSAPPGAKTTDTITLTVVSD